MAEALLGPSFDIHGGGIDLAFPHHENELAQSMCAHPNATFASVWMHNGFLNVEGEKMSKSLGNFFTVRDLLDRGISGEVIRFVLLSTHYRQPMDWTQAKVEEAEQSLRKWLSWLSSTHLHFSAENWESYVKDEAYAPDSLVVRALRDDLNTPTAIARLHELHARQDADSANAALGSIIQLGLLTDPTRVDLLASSGVTFLKDCDSGTIIKVSSLVNERQQARSRRDFGKADAIRHRLKELGVEVTDTPDGPEVSLTREFDPKKLEALE
jgi:cysteinyl-tRNA synthetase